MSVLQWNVALMAPARSIGGGGAPSEVDRVDQVELGPRCHAARATTTAAAAFVVAGRRHAGTPAGLVMDLAEFIDAERAPIVAEWEAFARTLLPAARGMSRLALRDHADEILSAIVHDMRSRQTGREQAEKSQGRGDAQHLEGVGQLHAGLRIDFGFKLGQMVAEYRALRASVLRLWEKKREDDPGGVTRFNEAIDEALTEAVHRFMETTEHYRDQTLGILGHDLRNPLSAIITGAAFLLDLETLDDRTVGIASRMLSSANRMSRMIADLLDLTRTRFGDLIPVVPVPVDLEPLCRQVVAELEGLRPSGTLRFVGRGDLRGEWDSDRIAQVLSNLVRNAIQHGAANEPIEVRATGSGADVVVDVHNGGSCIPENALATIFEPMVRHTGGDHTKTGVGLGLYIASQIVLAHGGKLDVTSTEAGGTTFTIHLPRRSPTLPA
jgi:signal transduction histidine kinase